MFVAVRQSCSSQLLVACEALLGCTPRCCTAMPALQEALGWLEVHFKLNNNDFSTLMHVQFARALAASANVSGCEAVLKKLREKLGSRQRGGGGLLSKPFPFHLKSSSDNTQLWL